jgi:hypothetical protein
MARISVNVGFMYALKHEGQCNQTKGDRVHYSGGKSNSRPGCLRMTLESHSEGYEFNS